MRIMIIQIISIAYHRYWTDSKIMKNTLKRYLRHDNQQHLEGNMCSFKVIIMPTDCLEYTCTVIMESGPR